MPASTRKPEPKLHGMRSREDLFPAEPKIESFLTEFPYSARGLARRRLPRNETASSPLDLSPQRGIPMLHVTLFNGAQRSGVRRGARDVSFSEG
jgi:hypothetical protein